MKIQILVMYVINDLILKSKNESEKLPLSQIGRTHRVGEKEGRTRDIIVRFISYRDRALVFRNTKKSQRD